MNHLCKCCYQSIEITVIDAKNVSEQANHTNQRGKEMIVPYGLIFELYPGSISESFRAEERGLPSVQVVGLAARY